MIALWILLGIFALLALLLSLKLCFHIEYREELAVTVRVLGIPISLYPRKQKRVDPSDYSLRALGKKRKKAARKAAKKKRKRQDTTESSTRKPKEPTGVLTFLRRFLRIVLEKTFGYLRVRVERIRVTVATGDPASTAILFGAINASVIYLLEMLDRFGKFDGKRTAELSVKPDFTATQTKMDIHLVLSLRIWHVFAILFRVFLTHLENKKQENKA